MRIYLIILLILSCFQRFASNSKLDSFGIGFVPIGFSQYSFKSLKESIGELYSTSIPSSFVSRGFYNTFDFKEKWGFKEQIVLSRSTLLIDSTELIVRSNSYHIMYSKYKEFKDNWLIKPAIGMGLSFVKVEENELIPFELLQTTLLCAEVNVKRKISSVFDIGTYLIVNSPLGRKSVETTVEINSKYGFSFHPGLYAEVFLFRR